MIGVVIVSRHPVLCEGLRVMIGSSEKIAIAGVVSSFDDSLVAESASNGAVVLADFDKSTSLKTLQGLCGRTGYRVCLLVHELAPEFLFQLREIGVAGIISMRRTQAELVHAVTVVGYGQLHFDPWFSNERLQAETVHLSPREGQLVELLTRGLKNKEIATELGITEGTVKVYLSKLFQKVGAKDRFELALSGLKNLGRTPALEPHRDSRIPSDRSVGLQTFVTRHFATRANDFERRRGAA
jgi:two-component system, NarL family, nitrate/nitrite response regulator NarL